MKQWTKLLARFAVGMLVGGGLLVVFYCLTLPAKPFVYVGF